LEQLIKQAIKVQTQHKVQRLSNDQSVILQKINQSISSDLQERYQILITKRNDEILTNEEYQELLNIGEQVEAIDAKRIEYLTELASLRHTSLAALIQEFQLQPKAI